MTLASQASRITATFAAILAFTLLLGGLVYLSGLHSAAIAATASATSQPLPDGLPWG